MAEAILFSLAEAILKKLGSGVLNEMWLWWGVNDNLKKLKVKVAIVQGVLLDAEEKSSTNNGVKEWLGQLKEVFLEADDLLDEVMPVLDSSGCAFFSSIWSQIVYGIKMAHRVPDIIKRLNEIAESRNFLLDERSLEKSVVTLERDTHSSPPATVVGREDDKRVIMNSLLSAYREDGVGYISIVGIGGLGKTTLAQLVFNDEKVKESFELRLWACVSDNFDLKAIIGKILGQETSKDINTLKEHLHEKINGKRYLLVLDDVWSDDLENLTDLLVGGSRGSRVIVTTRLKKVAHMTQPILVHEMEGLSEMDSWSLLKQMAFLKGQAWSDDHEKIGKEILKKCCGVPLAIRAIGRLLRFKETVAEWRAFKDKEIMKIDEEKDSIRRVLEISYNHLPPPLKNCFVYCRLFPKDSRIDVPELINYWVAQGFVKVSDATQCPMHVGLEYFMELTWRSFFQEVENDKWGNIYFCKMHDLIHDLATELAGVESVMFDSVENSYVDGRTLHASFFFDPDTPWKLPASLLKAGNLRTLLLENREVKGSQWDVIISNFRRLRILYVYNSNISKIPGSISKLKYLKHLDLSYNTDIEVLPNSITKLYNLLTLTLDYCYKIKQLPKDTKNLVNLSQLSLEWCFDLTHMPQGMGQLISLHKLSTFIVAKNSFTTKHVGTLKDLGGLNNLRGKLEIINLGHVRKAMEFQEANLKEKQHLQELKLDWGRDNNFEDVEGTALEALQPHVNLKVLTVYNYRGSKIPRWLSSLVNLVELSLDGCVNWRHLPPMHQLCNLKRLSIIKLQSLEYIDNEPTTKSAIGGRGESTSTTWASSFFPSLETLELWNCPNLEGWWRTTPTQSPTFPCLSQLKIHSCPKMTLEALQPHLNMKVFTVRGSKIPRWLSSLVNLVELSLDGCVNWRHLPPMHQLCNLKRLSITKLQSLEYIDNEPTTKSAIGGRGESTSTTWASSFFPSLKTLQLEFCPNLEGWWRTTPTESPRFPCLSQLTIHSCPKIKMTSMPLFPTLKTLEFVGGSVISLKEILNTSTAPAEECTSSSSAPSTFSLALSRLEINSIEDMESLPEDLAQNLPSLKRLSIRCCNGLKTLGQALRHLTSLKELIINSCSNLNLFEDAMHWQTLGSLRSLIIFSISTLEFFPKWFQQAMPSLQKLFIDTCPNLECLPEWMGQLPSLQNLSIDNCPQLSERCGSNKGADWPNIASIPNITIDFKVIQQNGRYVLS